MDTAPPAIPAYRRDHCITCGSANIAVFHESRFGERHAYCGPCDEHRLRHPSVANAKSYAGGADRIAGRLLIIIAAGIAGYAAYLFAQRFMR